MSLYPHLHTPFPPFSPSLISLMVSVDVKHHVYLLQHPFSLSVPAEAGCLFAVVAGVHLRGEPTLFPGWCANKKLCYSNL